MKMNKTLSSGKSEDGSGTFGYLVGGTAQLVTPNGLSWSGMSTPPGAETIYGQSAVRGENFMDSGHTTSRPVTRGVKHVRGGM
jgi:hypothetical protein